jgi:lactoylglutathione lyase
MNGKLTHLALPCHNLEKTIEWYERFTPLQVIHQREDNGAKVAWIQADNKSIFLVFLQSPNSTEPTPILSPFAHLGIEMESKDEVNAIAEEGRLLDCLIWEPRQEPDPVGYVCALSDPDGNLVEFSCGQSIK